eukprot:MONOS_4527.1-p1 / transcript=MONOS_4527.1 / gene=MONOS_4527 / organism=Monocercomonoides_exilis_PA203 / gene_product=unspecified product / transcript_product=unspecified product / location=Mono_scaffold00121:75104-76978(-) / protein_length=490 / sequence_SO=supercontig / SO=protein_coding / is_pseudo=false
MFQQRNDPLSIMNSIKRLSHYVIEDSAVSEILMQIGIISILEKVIEQKINDCITREALKLLSLLSSCFSANQNHNISDEAISLLFKFVNSTNNIVVRNATDSIVSLLSSSSFIEDVSTMENEEQTFIQTEKEVRNSLNDNLATFDILKAERKMKGFIELCINDLINFVKNIEQNSTSLSSSESSSFTSSTSSSSSTSTSYSTRRVFEQDAMKCFHQECAINISRALLALLTSEQLSSLPQASIELYKEQIRRALVPFLTSKNAEVKIAAMGVSMFYFTDAYRLRQLLPSMELETEDPFENLKNTHSEKRYEKHVLEHVEMLEGIKSTRRVSRSRRPKKQRNFRTTLRSEDGSFSGVVNEFVPTPPPLPNDLLQYQVPVVEIDDNISNHRPVRIAQSYVSANPKNQSIFEIPYIPPAPPLPNSVTIPRAPPLLNSISVPRAPPLLNSVTIPRAPPLQRTLHMPPRFNRNRGMENAMERHIRAAPFIQSVR